MFDTPEHLLRRTPSSLYHQKKGNLSSFYEQPRHFFSQNKTRWWFPNVYLREVIQFDLKISQTGLLPPPPGNKKKSSPSPCLRTPPTSPPFFPQFDNMILTPDGHLKLLDFGTGDQERKTFLGGKLRSCLQLELGEWKKYVFFGGGVFVWRLGGGLKKHVLCSPRKLGKIFKGVGETTN